MGNEHGHVLAVHTVGEHENSDDDKNQSHCPSGDLDTEYDADDRHVFIQIGFGSGAVVDILEVPDPVNDRDGGEDHEHVVNYPAGRRFRPINEKDRDVCYEDVDPAMILRGGRDPDG